VLVPSVRFIGLKIRSMKRDKGIESLPFSKSRRPNRKARPNRYELERQICCRSTHRSCHDASDVCTAPRRLAEGRVVGAVSDDGRSVGDLCFAVREVEITPGRSPITTSGSETQGGASRGVVERLCGRG
jgi:hypothetical protein